MLCAAAADARALPDALRCRVMHRLCLGALAPYVSLLEAWLHHGALDADVKGEFFVHAAGDASAGGRAGEEGEEGDGSGRGGELFWERFAPPPPVQSGHVSSISSY